MGKFEFDGEKYKKASTHQKEWGNKLISEMHLSGDEAILDLGCGDGVLSEQLSMLVPNGKVTGIDASVGMIKTAQQLEKANLIFICMDINDIKYINCFDVIFSNAALHWVKNHQKLLESSFTALRPNGMLRWNFAGDGNCSNFFETVKTVMNENLYKKYFLDFQWPWFMPSKDNYKKIIAKLGFSKFEIEYENVDRYFTNCEEMIKWIDQPSIVPFISHIPNEKKSAFRNSVVEMMKDKTKQQDGRCFETFRRINISAKK